MASELATQIEPLIQIASTSLMSVDTFLTGLTGIKLDYNIQREPRWEQKRPNSAFNRHRSVSEEPGHKSPNSLGPTTPQRAKRYGYALSMLVGGQVSGKNSPSISPASLEFVNVENHGHHASHHRNSVGSIDTETFGIIRNRFPSHETVNSASQTPQPCKVVDTDHSHLSTRTYSLDGKTYRGLWSEDSAPVQPAEPNNSITSSGGEHIEKDCLHVYPSSGCDSMSISPLP